MKNRLFRHTRWQLTGWYALVMGLIFSLCGLVVYRIMIRAYLFSVDRELEAVTDTLRKSIQRNLKQPALLDANIQQLLPDICMADTPCPERPLARHGHSVGNQHLALVATYEEDYYIRFVSKSGQLIASSGLRPAGLPLTSSSQAWQTLRDEQGDRYHQVAVLLHIPQNNQHWGYMQVGRSLKDVDDRLGGLKLALLIGLPVIVLLVGGSSWWLAQLAMRPIYQSYQQMQQFTADTAHELRTPLASILATVESSLRLPTLAEPDARDTLTTIERQAYRLFELVKDLLLLSRLEQHTLTIQFQPICLNELIADLIEEFTDLTAAAQLQLTAEIRPDQSVMVMADSDQCYRLMTNLIANAIQYTPVGGQIILRLDQAERQALLQVQDTGIGIAPIEQRQIFSRFYRVAGDRSRQTGGSGLGLAIAMAIVQAHRGRLEVASVLGKGSTFTVRLPLCADEPFHPNFTVPVAD
jgi:signal transduction histidine kinase